jgi:hypothetical protein
MSAATTVLRPARPQLEPVRCARRTEPSAWLCPPPGAARLPDGVNLLHTDVTVHGQAALALRQAATAAGNDEEGPAHA